MSAEAKSQLEIIENVEKFQFELNQDLAQIQIKRKALDSIQDYNNALPLMIQEIQLRSIIDRLNFYFPQKINNF